ncbi:MAG: tetratricopeptide repeat protein [Planctomycetota bacterium]|jgi:tetratricopeptide (TPR) repeat protein
MKLWLGSRVMTYRSETDYVTLKGKGVFLVLILSLALVGTSIAGEKTKPDRKYPSSKTLRSMARVYMAYGEYAQAQPLAEKALILAKREHTSDYELAMCLIDLAALYKNQGKLLDAEKMCESGLCLQEKVLYKNHPYLAYTLSTLSSIYCEQGKYYQARSTLDKAMAIMLDGHSADDKAMAPFFVDIAKLHVAQGDLEEAERYYQKAMLLINSSYGPDHLYTANVLAGIAKLFTLQERYAEAEELINRAVTVQEKIYGPDHYLIAASWLTKAKICQVRGAHAQAEKLISKALVAVEKTGNMAAFTKLARNVEEIRASKQITYEPIAKADK